MDLFSGHQMENRLPHDGEVLYYGPIMDRSTADFYVDRLLNGLAWKNDEAVFFGKRVETKRKVAWYGNEAYVYTYSSSSKLALPWTDELAALKHITEEKSGHGFNSCLANLYHNGEEGMAWHSDDETALGRNTVIASLSFGAERKFSFKHKSDKTTVSLLLEHGSLLLMKGTTQTHWWHRLPPTQKVTRPRVNLTFRTIVRQD